MRLRRLACARHAACGDRSRGVPGARQRVRVPARRVRRALAERAGGLPPGWLARISPHLTPKGREWRWLKRAVHGHLAHTGRDFVGEIIARAAPAGRGAPGSRRPPQGADRTPWWATEGRG
ncbi:MAG: hypothetical protein AVDCRST_MAG88-2342 [uncultured Thermomicrobiales bacterium]|uniref:Uncharacterized protein n=1 Tax=uncultured Thermomicrobiales bacterium TaxID=1645740 RepID=A0A6J4VDN0_9BACT|nr:MAG: hypothetical protein AVDCRST_MAG88-2342 [uncultured Thermomicrobiales bacterium]